MRLEKALLAIIVYGAILLAIFILLFCLRKHIKRPVCIAVCAGILLFLLLAGGLYWYDVYGKPPHPEGLGIKPLMRWLTFDDDFFYSYEKIRGIVVTGVLLGISLIGSAALLLVKRKDAK